MQKLSLQQRTSLSNNLVQAAHICPVLSRSLAQRLSCSSFLASLLAEKGLSPDEACTFLNGTLKEQLPDPSQLPDIEKGMTLVAQAIHHSQKIALWGDYDVDGATSVAVWRRFLHAYGCTPRVYIPDRFKEGYGPNVAGIQKLAKEGVQLLITLDCGTTAHAPLAEANKAGMQVIVIDHHAPDNTLPPAAAIINPKCINNQNQANIATKTDDLTILAAVGVSFFCLITLRKHLHADTQQKQLPQRFDLRTLLDLVALGTVCDVVPLVGVNRLLVKQGLKIAQKGLNQGLCALCHEAGVAISCISAHHFGFVLGPRLNAGGRISNTHLASQLLSTSDKQEAQTLAKTLGSLNMLRKTIEKQTLEEALLQLPETDKNAVVIVHEKQWHEGVIGICAARLKDKVNKPVFVLTFDKNNRGKGSARAPKGFDIGALIQAALKEGVIEQGGGHHAAGGLSLTAAQLPAFKTFCTTYKPAQSSLPQTIHTFTAKLPFSALSDALWNDRQRLAPFGAHNDEPLFLFENIHLVKKHLFGGGHMNLWLTQQDGQHARAVLFQTPSCSLGAFLKQPYLEAFDMLATLSWNDYTNNIQLIVKDILCTHRSTHTYKTA